MRKGSEPHRPGEGASAKTREPALVRRAYRVAIVVAVTPIVVAAIRNGLAGWVPTRDAAVSAVRIRDVLSSHPPLIGLAGFASIGNGPMFSYLGAPEFYLLAFPVKLFGVSWGILIGMAVINSAFVVGALWLTRRRFGERGALLAAVVLGSLLWTVGSQMLVDPTPVSMVVIPTFTLLIAAWSVADDDPSALLILAFSGNYLLLSHPEYSLVAPVVGLYALASWGRRLRQYRRSGSDRWQRRWRIERKWVGAAVLCTALLWVPPLVDQFFGTGNLSTVVRSAMSGDLNAMQKPELAPTLGGALGVLVSVTAVPPFWLPPNFSVPPFDVYGGGTPFVVGLLGFLVLFGLLGWVAWAARRRGDRTLLAAIGVGVCAWLAYFLTALRNPDILGYEARYYLGLWALSAYLWLVVAFGAARALPRLTAFLRSRADVVSVGAVLMVTILAVLTFPYANNETVDSTAEVPINREIRNIVGDRLRSEGPALVLVGAGAQRFEASALLGLQDSNVPIRVPSGFKSQQYGRHRDVGVHHDFVTRLFVSRKPMTTPGLRLLGVAYGDKTGMSPRRFRKDTKKMQEWAQSDDRLRINPELNARTPVGMGVSDMSNDLDTTRCGGSCLLHDPTFLTFLVTFQPVLSEPIYLVPGMDRREMTKWAREMLAQEPAAYVYEAPTVVPVTSPR